MIRTLGLIAVVAGVFGTLPMDVLADEAETKAVEDEVSTAPPDEAMVQFQQGKEFYNQGVFEKAAIALKRAYQLRPGYRILYFLGWAENEIGNYTRALEAFNGFLAEALETEDAAKIADVETEVVRLEARVGHLNIKCDANGAKVKVDNETRGETPLTAPIPVDVGRHEVVVKIDQTELLREVIRIAGGQEVTLEAASLPAPTPEERRAVPPPEKVPAEEKVPPPQKKKRIWTYVAYGFAAAAAVAAGVTGALTLDLENEMWDQCTDDGICYGDEYDGDFHADQDKLRTLAITTDVLIGVAAAGVIAGTVLFFIEPKRRSREQAASGRPQLVIGAGGAALTGRF